MTTSTIHLVLTYVENDPETYVEAFETKSQAIQSVLDGIKSRWEENHWEDGIDEEDRRVLERETAQAKAALEEKGVWKDADGNTYVHKETEIHR